MINSSKFMIFGALMLLSAGSVGVASGTADAHDLCLRVYGQISLTPTDPAGCGSAVGVCAVGELRGTLRGDSAFVGTSFVPTVDIATTGAALLTGDNAIHTRRGTLYTKDAVVLRTVGEGEFSEIDTIVGGTGDFEGATGVLTAYGTYDAAAGGEGTYFGTVCVE